MGSYGSAKACIMNYTPQRSISSLWQWYWLIVHRNINLTSHCCTTSSQEFMSNLINSYIYCQFSFFPQIKNNPRAHN